MFKTRNRNHASLDAAGAVTLKTKTRLLPSPDMRPRRESLGPVVPGGIEDAELFLRGGGFSG